MVLNSRQLGMRIMSVGSSEADNHQNKRRDEMKEKKKRKRREKERPELRKKLDNIQPGIKGGRHLGRE